MNFNNVKITLGGVELEPVIVENSSCFNGGGGYKPSYDHSKIKDRQITFSAKTSKWTFFKLDYHLKGNRLPRGMRSYK